MSISRTKAALGSIGTAVKLSSFVERVKVKLSEGPEAHITRYAKDTVKHYQEQIKLAQADNEDLLTKIEEKEEEIAEAAENINLSAIKTVDSRREFILDKSAEIARLFKQVDALKFAVEVNNKHIAINERLLDIYA